MPTRAPSVCGHCGKAHSSGEMCATGLRLQRERKARFDKKRPTARQRGYDTDWQRESKSFLAIHPTCIRCGQASAIIDHVTPHKGNMTLFWDRRNWQAICSPCHNRWKQSQERKPS